MHLPASDFDDFETTKKNPKRHVLALLISETTHEHHHLWLFLFGKKILMAVLKE